MGQEEGADYSATTSAKETYPSPASATTVTPLCLTASLEEFQTSEQRLVLDTVAQIRKCGLDTVLPLPQVVVCGDQSSGKSSVLEALTEVPFPRNDNLCTRFATEITLRHGPHDSLRLCIIPDESRASNERSRISAFSEQIQNFDQLPEIMAKAMTEMGLDTSDAKSPADKPPRAFARDVLSLEIEGPQRPQLTVVDVPGLIQTETKGVSKEDKQMVAEITDFYIKQRRTICLAVISATNDYANQPILTKVREVDPEGSRTLGIITKPDRLDHGSGMEEAFLALARNEDIFFQLGWHVIKNRRFEEAGVSIAKRNASEAEFFRRSNFKQLPTDCVGIDALRVRISGLLFEHIKRELPKLRTDLEQALAETTAEFSTLGPSRATALDCRNYLTSLSLTCLEITRAATNGHYEGDYFRDDSEDHFDPQSPKSVRRLRASVQFVNKDFAETMRQRGPKYRIDSGVASPSSKSTLSFPDDPILLSQKEALDWTARVLVRSRGKEPVGNYNPLIIGELFWELSSRWQAHAEEYLNDVEDMCKLFVDTLLGEKSPGDIKARLSAAKIRESLRLRKSNALAELQKILEDKQEFPCIYNHYYTDTVQKSRTSRLSTLLSECVKGATTHNLLPGCQSDHTSASIDIPSVIRSMSNETVRDMEKYSCEEALDCVLAMYKAEQKTFVENVTTQVVERHMIRGLDKIFSPMDVNGMSDEDVMKIASEPPATRRTRDFLADRLEKLRHGREIFREITGAIK